MPTTAAIVEAVAVTSGAAATLASNNRGRRGLYVFNAGAGNLYVKCGESASSASHTVMLPAGAFWEFPSGPHYTGIVTGRFASGSGDVMVTSTYG